ncbi:hypothetical protein M231_03928 [Tremella mesenterica]|uniref:Uncharacterized protein n=1 Tax=Tremella mesenterica TaxID=5217 RepID=A0A4Q1BM80_TREME|nr:hypothetical protein M231_03928 [Tremella mesenterica]
MEDETRRSVPTATAASGVPYPRTSTRPSMPTSQGGYPGYSTTTSGPTRPAQPTASRNSTDYINGPREERPTRSRKPTAARESETSQIPTPRSHGLHDPTSSQPESKKKKHGSHHGTKSSAHPSLAEFCFPSSKGTFNSDFSPRYPRLNYTVFT